MARALPRTPRTVTRRNAPAKRHTSAARTPHEPVRMSASHSRRNFLKHAALAGAALAAANRGRAENKESKEELVAADDHSFGDNPPPENLAAKGEVPRRKFGKTDQVVSAMALGGHTFATAKTKEESIRIVQEAIDGGITFMDNAWEYHEGSSES